MDDAVTAEVVLADAVEVDAAAGTLTLRGTVAGNLSATLLDAARGLPARDVEVRCAGLTGLDAAALQVLLALERARRAEGHHVTLVGVDGSFAALLRATGAAELFEGATP